ncbi:MAG: Single-stranded DNA-binding protein [Chlamydiae bacterium]|nr:Single-stranded DNA-binding protein [Chlamydiota bacterium]
MNWLQIAGHLGADPEERFTATGQKVVTLRLAAHSRKGGQDMTIWWRVTIWGDRFDKILPYFKKGSPLIVIGEMGKPEIYTDKEGRPQVSLDIVADVIKFSPFGKGSSSSEGKQGDFAQKTAAVASQPASESSNTDDEIPF